MPDRTGKAPRKRDGLKIEEAVYLSPIGPLAVSGSERGIRSIGFLDGRRAGTKRIPSCLLSAFDQLDEYFRGKRRIFSLELDLEGTAYQKKVWKALLKIPFGKTASYGAIATATGNGRAARAVGSANHRNPVAIVIPCHRVIGKDGRLTGYGGGLWRKQYLLDLEAHNR